MQRLRLNDAGVVDGVGQQTAGGLRGHQHLAAVSPDQAAVLHQRVDCALIHRDVEQLVARHVKRERVAGGQRHRSQPGGERSLVAHICAEQRDVATVGCVDRSLIHDRARARAGKLVIARHEAGVADRPGRSHQPTNIDRRALAEQDAVGVDEKHLAVGPQAAQNSRRVGADDPVQRHCTAAGLHELY